MDFGTVCLLLITIVKQPLSWYFFQFQFQRDLSSEGHRCWASCCVVRFTQICPLSTLLFIVTVADMVRAARDAAQPEQEAIWERRVPGPPENVRTLPRAQTQSCPQRGKVPIHRKALTNSTTPRPMASRTLPRKPPPHPYNTISTLTASWTHGRSRPQASSAVVPVKTLCGPRRPHTSCRRSTAAWATCATPPPRPNTHGNPPYTAMGLCVTRGAPTRDQPTQDLPPSPQKATPTLATEWNYQPMGLIVIRLAVMARWTRLVA